MFGEKKKQNPRRQGDTGLRDATALEGARMSRPLFNAPWSSGVPAVAAGAFGGDPRHKVHAHTTNSAAATAVTAMKMAISASLIMPNTVAGPIGRLGTITAVLRGVG
jgi:hypothetical protein